VLTRNVCVLLMQAEGLVHVSNISSARLSLAKDAVERGQDVWVKVVSVRWVAGGV
jgi:ribosomal protein S1